MKEKISVGGRVTPEGIVELQGDQCDGVVVILKAEGFAGVKKSGGSSKK
jgi:translation initiation factor 1 (eIF-1/SUI1)